LSLKYKEMLANGLSLPGFEEVGFRAYSQNDEDGILWYIFSLIGVTNKHVVDLGAGYAVLGSNVANLIINHGWIGLLVDGSQTRIRAGRAFYKSCPDTWLCPPKLVASRITQENVNSILIENGFSGEIDLLSLDIDGIDYWVWKAIDCVKPRVVVVEYQPIWGPERAVTIPYDPDFQATYDDASSEYYGASLAAFVGLSTEKGYRLVGCNRYGNNAFFVRADVDESILPGIPPVECFKHPYARLGTKERLPEVVDLDWAEV
jgi:hypothetical protein